MAQNINDNLSDLVDALNRLMDNQSDCCAGSGISTDTPGNDGTVDIGPGLDFENSAAYIDYKCRAANWIFDGVESTITALRDNRADLFFGGFGAVTTGLVTILLLSGPPGWAATLAEIVITSVAAIIFQQAIDFDALLTALSDQQDECVFALYNSSNAPGARDGFLAALSLAPSPPSPVELKLISVILRNAVVNNVFTPSEDIKAYDDGDVDCGDALVAIWDFDADYESWTFRDDSVNGASSSRSYDSVGQAIQVNNVVAAQVYSVAVGVNVSPSQALVLAAGSSIQADFLAPDDGIVQAITLRGIYNDLSSEETTIGNFAGSSTIVLNLADGGTLQTIEVEFSRSNGPTTTTYDYNTWLTEVRVFGAS